MINDSVCYYFSNAAHYYYYILNTSWLNIRDLDDNNSVVIMNFIFDSVNFS